MLEKSHGKFNGASVRRSKINSEATNVIDGNEGSIKPFTLGRDSSEVFCIASYNKGTIKMFVFARIRYINICGFPQFAHKILLC